jgi:hypothetical protein
MALGYTRGALYERSNQTTVNCPVTLGVGCGKGEFPSGRVVAVLFQGLPVAAQVDVRRLWNDGSVCHMMVSFLAPLIRPNLLHLVEFVQDNPRQKTTPLSVHSSLTAAGIQGRISFVDSTDAKTYTATSSNEATKLCNAETGVVDPATDLAGPVMAETEEWVTLKDSLNNAHRWATARIAWRFYDNWPGARLDFTLENCPVPLTSGESFARGTKFGDIPFTSLQFLIGGTTFKTLASGTFYDATRALVRGWAGLAPPLLIWQQEFKYLAKKGFFPPYDYTKPLSATEAASVNSRVTGGPGSGRGNVDTTNWPETGIPFDSGPIYNNMPGTGGRPDIGGAPTWAICRQNNILGHVAAWGIGNAADGNGSGNFPIHYRDPTSREPGIRHNHPGLLNTNVFSPSGDRVGDVNPANPDRSHGPGLGLYTYLMTGDKFHAEETSFWAVYSVLDWPKPGYVRKEARYGAWATRNLAHGSFFCPKVTSDFTTADWTGYLESRLQATLDNFALAVNDTTNLPLGVRAEEWKYSGRAFFPVAYQSSPWQYAWFAWTFYNVWRMSQRDTTAFGKAKSLFDWWVRYFTFAFAPPGWKNYHTKAWKFTAATGVKALWYHGNTFDYTLAPAGHTPALDTSNCWKDPGPSGITMLPSMGELCYQLAVNHSWEFTQQCQQDNGSNGGYPPPSSWPSPDPSYPFWNHKSGTWSRWPAQNWEIYGGRELLPAMAAEGTAGGWRAFDYLQGRLEPGFGYGSGHAEDESVKGLRCLPIL